MAALSEPGIPVASGIRFERDCWRVRIALAWTGREGSWVARDPELELAGVRRVTALQEDWDAATEALRRAGHRRPGLLAAWWGLDPQRIAWLVEHPKADPLDAPSVTRPTSSIGDELPNHRLLIAMRQLGSETPGAELVQLAEEAGLDDVAASLELTRWECGVAPWPERLILWLMNHGYTARAIDIATRWHAQATAVGQSDALAVATQRLGMLCYLVADLPRARAYLEQSATLARRSSVDAGSDLLRDLRSATLLCSLGRVEEEQGRWQQAQQCFEHALALALDVAKREPSVQDTTGGLARASALCDDVDAHGQVVTAALRELDAIGSNGDAQRQVFVGRLLRSAGENELRAHEVVAARQHFQQSVGTTRALLERDPERLDFQRELVRALRDLGWVYIELGLFKAARNVLDESVVIAATLVARAPDSVLAGWDFHYSLRALKELDVQVGNSFRAFSERRGVDSQAFTDSGPKPPGFPDLALAHLELALADMLDQALRSRH